MISPRIFLIPVATLAVLLAGLATAEAHTLLFSGVGMTSGFWHPLTGIDHLVTMLAVGIWAVYLGREWTWALPACFLVAMLAGALLGLQGIVMPMLEPGIQMFLLLLGGIMVSQVRPGASASLAVVALSGIWHGNAHTYDIANAGNEIFFISGLLAMTGVLHIIGIGIGFLTRRHDLYAARLPGLVMVGTGAILLIS